MSTAADEQVIIPSRISDVITIVAAVLAAAVALVQIVRADTGVLERALAVPAVVLAAVLIIRSWQPAACDRRLFRLQVAALAALMLAAGALVPTALAAGLIVAASLRIGRDVAGWRGLGAIVAIAAAHGVGLAVHGADMIAPAAACGFIAVFIYGMAEPERGAWCACEWAKRGAIRNLEIGYLRSDERPRRRP
jgi:phosphoglycerol transferase MdoB-like AlkP superfamily enzyme